MNMISRSLQSSKNAKARVWKKSEPVPSRPGTETKLARWYFSLILRRTNPLILQPHLPSFLLMLTIYFSFCGVRYGPCLISLEVSTMCVWPHSCAIEHLLSVIRVHVSIVGETAAPVDESFILRYNPGSPQSYLLTSSRKWL